METGVHGGNANGKTTPDSVILVNDLHKYFGSKKALNGVSFSVKRGEIFALLGPNGAGKTTTMRVILGLLSPSKGSVSIFGKPPLESSGESNKISAVLEKDVLWDKFTGNENVLIASRLWMLDAAQAKKDAKEYAEMLNFVDALSRPVFTYSKGMLRKLSLILALIKHPDLLVLDEPNSGIDTESRLDIRKILLMLREQGKTVFLTSHDLEEVRKIADRITIITRGRIVYSNKVSAIKSTGKFSVRIKKGQGKSFDKIAAYLESAGVPYEVKDGLLTAEPIDDESIVSHITEMAVKEGHLIKEVKEKEESIEEMYIKIVKNEEGQKDG